MNKIEFARLVNYIASFCRLEDYQIVAIDELTKCATPEPAKIDRADVDKLLDAMKRGAKIDAIKHYRSLTGAGLLESKNTIEANWTPVKETQYKAVKEALDHMTGEIREVAITYLIENFNMYRYEAKAIVNSYKVSVVDGVER